MACIVIVLFALKRLFCRMLTMVAMEGTIYDTGDLTVYYAVVYDLW